MPVFTGTCSVHLVESCQHADRSSVPCWPAVSPGVRGDMPTDPRYRPAGRPGRTGRRQYADKSSVPGWPAVSPGLRGDMPTDPRYRAGLRFHLGCVAICRQILGTGQQAGQDVRVGGNMPTNPRYRPAGRPGRAGRRQYADKSSVAASGRARTYGSAAICGRLSVIRVDPASIFLERTVSR